MKSPSHDTGTITRSAGIVSIAVFLSRILGLIREQVFAGLFGAGFAYDAFVVGFRIPNLLRDLFAEGALSSALVTVFSEYDHNRGKIATWRLANNILTFSGIFTGLIILAGIFFSQSLVLSLAPDFAGVAGKVALTQKLTIIMFPFLTFISLAAVVMGILNSKGHFFIPSLASSFFNLGSIAGGVLLSLVVPYIGQPPIVGMAIGTLIGGLCQLVIQIPALSKTGFILKPCLDLKDKGLQRILRLMVPAIIGLSATQFNIFINTNFAASCIEGSVSWLNYAFRLVQFPIGLFGVAISIATLPIVARYAAARDIDRLKETYVSSLILGCCLNIPATVGLFVLAEPIIRIIFQHGAFTAHDTLMTAQALSFYSLGLFAYSSVKIVVPVFYALNDTKYPVIGSFLAVGANVVIILFTIDHLQHRSIALSTSCAMAINFLFLSVVLYRKVSGYALSYIFLALGKITLASLIMGGWLVYLNGSLAEWFSPTLTHNVMGLIIAIGSAVILYGGILYILHLNELTLLITKCMAKVHRGR